MVMNWCFLSDLLSFEINSGPWKLGNGGDWAHMGGGFSKVHGHTLAKLSVLDCLICTAMTDGFLWLSTETRAGIKIPWATRATRFESGQPQHQQYVESTRGFKRFRKMVQLCLH